jgi:hypothetical protein
VARAGVQGAWIMMLDDGGWWEGLQCYVGVLQEVRYGVWFEGEGGLGCEVCLQIDLERGIVDWCAAGWGWGV